MADSRPVVLLDPYELLAARRLVLVLAAATSKDSGLIGAVEPARLADGAKITVRSRADVVDDLALVLRGLAPVRMQNARPETVGMQRSRPGLAGTKT